MAMPMGTPTGHHLRDAPRDPPRHGPAARAGALSPLIAAPVPVAHPLLSHAVASARLVARPRPWVRETRSNSGPRRLRQRTDAPVRARSISNGIAKTTYATSAGSNGQIPGLQFMLKYLPTTAAIDSCNGNYCTTGSFPDGEKSQGRAQLIDPGFYTQRNCAMFSATDGYTTDSAVTNMHAPSSLGGDCSYYSGYKYTVSSATVLYTAFAPTADTCCKACAATDGCVSASFYTGSDSLARTWDTTAPSAAPKEGHRRLQPEPYRGEGFGLHLVDVKASATTGGIDAVRALTGLDWTGGIDAVTRPPRQPRAAVVACALSLSRRRLLSG
jgi:hypothetical protein